ncbi:MAG: cobalamin biosynthesis protein [bacterium]|nr:cobalamin biosynthesis protein [bacterium]
MTEKKRKRAVIAAFTGEGSRLAAFLCSFLGAAEEWESEAYVPARFLREEWRAFGVKERGEPLAEWAKVQFQRADALIFIGAAGIAVRAVAPMVRDKLLDAAVLVLDEKGQYVIPLLSGHVGGGNALAKYLASALHALPVLTTASDVQQLFAVDVFAARNGFVIWNREGIRAITAELLEGRSVGVCFEEVQLGGRLPEGLYLERERESEKKHIYITPFQREEWLKEAREERAILLIPSCLTVGVGCRKGATQREVEESILQMLKKENIFPQAVRALASIDIKKEEEGIQKTAQKYGWKFETFSAEELLEVSGTFSESSFVAKTVGVGNVCERAAVCASEGRLWVAKTVGKRVTTAAAWKRPFYRW